MFLLSDHAFLCPPESLFSLQGESSFSPARPEGKPFIALWAETKSALYKTFKIVCCGRPVFASLKAEDLAWHPCSLLAQRVAKQLETASPEDALQKHTTHQQGSYTIIIWDTKSHHRWVYTQEQKCFADSIELQSVTPAPYTLYQKKLFVLPNKQVCSSQAPKPLEPVTQRFMPLDPLKPLERIVFKHLDPLKGPPKHLSFFAENISLCIARMIKDIMETRSNTQTHIFPIGAHIPTQTASAEHPFILLPSVFSPYAQKVDSIKGDHIHVINPTTQSDTFFAPLLHPLQQWVRVLSFLAQDAPESINGQLVFPVIEQLAPFIEQIKTSHRLYLGRNIFAGFARVCAYYDHAVTKTFSSHYPSGELKHGPLALVDNTVTSLIFCPHDTSFQKNLNGIKEIRARQGRVLAFTDPLGAQTLKKEGVHHITLDAHPTHTFITLAWLCIHRLMFLLDVA